jgi:hypothetical protein
MFPESGGDVMMVQQEMEDQNKLMMCDGTVYRI